MIPKLKEWAAPLIIFVGGELFFLIFLLFVPTIDTQVAITANVTANITATFWGWGWLMTEGVARSIALVGYQVMLFIAVGLAFMRSRV